MQRERQREGGREGGRERETEGERERERDLLDNAGQDEGLVRVGVDGVEVGKAHQVGAHQDAQVQALLHVFDQYSHQ
jgi:hypothetical protein